jgi:hypothetical protein
VFFDDVVGCVELFGVSACAKHTNEKSGLLDNLTLVYEWLAESSKMLAMWKCNCEKALSAHVLAHTTPQSAASTFGSFDSVIVNTA